jgi:type I restriction enzyme M protein
VKNDFPAIFKQSAVIDLKPVVFAYLVSQLQMYSLLESDIDVKDRAYEEIVGSNLRGDRGEFSLLATFAAWPSKCLILEQFALA